MSSAPIASSFVDHKAALGDKPRIIGVMPMDDQGRNWTSSGMPVGWSDAQKGSGFGARGALAVLFVVAAAGCLAVAIVTHFTDADPVPVAAAELKVGDCLALPPYGERTLLRVPCTQDHDSQVLGQLTLPTGTDFPGRAGPGQAEIDAAAQPGCQAAYTANLDPAVKTHSLVMSRLTPLPSEWASGDRTVLCLVKDITGLENLDTSLVRRAGT